MRITIFAATGGIGQHLVDQALAAGHDLTAVVRRPEKMTTEIDIVAADLTDPDPATLRAAVSNADAVLSCVGPRSKDEFGIVARGTRSIIDAMQQTVARRLVVVSGAGVSTVPTPDRPDAPKREPGAGWLNHYVNTPLARRVLGQHFVDVATMEDALRASDLDWTAVRPPLLTDRPLTGIYRTAYDRNVRRGFRLSRADAAHLMLAVINQPGTVRRAVTAAY